MNIILIKQEDQKQIFETKQNAQTRLIFADEARSLLRKNSWFNAGFTPFFCHGWKCKVLINHPTISCGRPKKYRPWIVWLCAWRILIWQYNIVFHIYTALKSTCLWEAQKTWNKITLMLTSQRRLLLLYIWWAAKESFLYVSYYMLFRTLTIHKHN